MTTDAAKLISQHRNMFSHATYLEEKSRTEFEASQGEISEADKKHRRSLGEAYKQQAAELRRKVAANEKNQAVLTQRRETIEQQMRDW